MSHRAHLVALALLIGLLTTACTERIVSGAPLAAPPAVATSAAATPTPQVPPTVPTSRPAYPVPLASADESPQPVLEVVDQGFSAYAVQYTGNVTSWAVKLRNPNSDTWIAVSAWLRITFTDASGAVVFVEETPVYGDVAPGQVIAFGATDSTARATGIATAMRVEVLDTDWTDGEYRTEGEITTGPATARPATGPGSDFSSKVIVDCGATSTFLSKVANFGVSVVYLDAQGRIIGGSHHSTDIDGAILSVPGGGTARFTVMAHFSPPSGVPAAECSANFVRPV